MTTPIRMCAGCRERAVVEELLRLALRADGVVVVDARRVLPGRGVNVHAACLDRALKTRAIVRGLRLTHGLTRDEIVGLEPPAPGES